MQTCTTASRWRVSTLIIFTMAANAADAAGQQSNAREVAGTAYTVPALHDYGTSWSFSVTPYVWASGIKGTVGVANQTTEIDISFHKIIEHLDAAFMLPLEAWRGRFGVLTDVMYTKISGGKATPGPLFTSAELDVSQFIGELSPAFRVINQNSLAADVFAGGRYWSLGNTLTLTPGLLPAQEFEKDEDWFDPFVGARAFYSLSSRWGLQARGDIGGFDVGSRLTWQALGLVSYRLSDLATVRAGWRQLDVDFRDGGFVYDVGLGGAIVGVTFTFGADQRAETTDR